MGLQCSNIFFNSTLVFLATDYSKVVVSLGILFFYHFLSEQIIKIQVNYLRHINLGRNIQVLFSKKRKQMQSIFGQY